jgi:MoxR-like ATPase
MTIPLRTHGRSQPTSSLRDAGQVLEKLRERLRSQVIGRDAAIDLLLIALLADGHVLLEDLPGSGKTTLAKTLGQAIDAPGSQLAAFRRIQFTADLLPSDVTGVSLFDARSSVFRFERGPIFAHVVLADEINRASPKVQSALLEAMGEKQVTVDDVTHELDSLFFVVATQNPLDHAGTYPLPVAQLDRFLFQLSLGPIEPADELQVLETVLTRRTAAAQPGPLLTRDAVLQARAGLEAGVEIAPEIRDCLVALAASLRADERVEMGCSTRSLVTLLPALQAHALLHGRDYVRSEDVESLAVPALAHRIVLLPGIDSPSEVVRECLADPLESLSRSTLRRRRR